MGALSHAGGPQLPARRVKQRQQFGGPVALILMRLMLSAAVGLPAVPGIGLGLIGTGLVLGPYRKPLSLALPVGAFN